MNYSYQKTLIKKAYKALFSHRHVVLAACPGAGKTHMAAKIMGLYLKEFPKRKILVFTHGQVILRQQWADMLLGHSFFDSYGVIKSGKLAKQKLRKHSLVLSLPQTLKSQVRLNKVDLLVVDEAHQRFFSNEMKGLVKKLSPTSILLLTGTPSIFINKEDFKIIGITIEELLHTGTITDPLIEIVKTKYKYSYKDIDNKTLKPIGGGELFSKKETDETLKLILPQILSKLTSENRQFPERYKWATSVTNWTSLAKKLQKTMVICNNQSQAKDVASFFSKVGIRSIVSISELGEGIEDIENFKSDLSVPILIVVYRGTLGFNFSELMNVIDLSGSLNVNRLFQALCRIVRPNPKSIERKLYLKATNDELSAITFYVMSFVVAMSTKKHYFSYSTNQRNTPINVPSDFLSLIENSKRNKGLPKVENLPHINSFSEIKSGTSTSTSTETIAYTTFDKVISMVYSQKDDFTRDSLEKAVRGSSNISELLKKLPSFYYWVAKLNIKNEEYSKWFLSYQIRHSVYTNEEIIDSARQCSNRTEFHNRFRTIESWARKNGKYHLIEKNITKLNVSAASKHIDEILQSKEFEIKKNGTLLKNGKPIRTIKRNGLVYFYYKNTVISLGRLIWIKFNGPILGRKAVRYRGLAPALNKLYLTTTRSKN